MKHLLFTVSLICTITMHSQDDTTARFYGLPDNVTASQTMEGTYNGETKELKPTLQEQILFNNGVATIIKKAEVFGSTNFASEFSMTYDTDGKLIKKDIISMEQNSTEPYKETLTYQYRTANSISRVSSTTESGKQLAIEDREYNKEGKLTKTTWHDQNGNQSLTIFFIEDYDEALFY